jgi:hypothetical protein
MNIATLASTPGTDTLWEQLEERQRAEANVRASDPRRRVIEHTMQDPNKVLEFCKTLGESKSRRRRRVPGAVDLSDCMVLLSELKQLAASLTPHTTGVAAS